MNYSLVWIAPKIDKGFLVTVNQGGANAACDEVLRFMVSHYK